MKRILWAAAALICIAIGFVLAQQYERNRTDTRIGTLQAQQDQEMARLRNELDTRVDSMARTQGEIVLQAFAAGISPAVLAGRREGVEIAAVSMLHVPGIAGIHVLALDGSVIYSSDAKLTATGEGNYRGAWALAATELIARPSTRPEVLDIAAPIVNAGTPQAVAWLEYDLAAVKAAAGSATERTSAMDVPVDATAPSSAAMPEER
jgi:hypothetical protein